MMSSDLPLVTHLQTDQAIPLKYHVTMVNNSRAIHKTLYGYIAPLIIEPGSLP